MILSLFVAGCIDTTNHTPSTHLHDPYTLYVSSTGDTQYNSIQQAIDEMSGDIRCIYVYEGIYYEHIVINKTVKLIGENKEKTIIDGNYTSDVIFIEEDGHLNISGFTIRNSGPIEGTYHDSGIDIESDNNTIIGNIICNNTNGVYSTDVKNNTFKQNIYLSNSGYGMWLHTASDECTITHNIFTNNSYGLRIKGSRDNNVSNNLFSENLRGLYFCCGSQDNTVYHNNFIDNSLWDGKDEVTGNNWDNGYVVGGNYWSNYSGKDEFNGPKQNIPGSDTFGDTPYTISGAGNANDDYPLIIPWVIS